MACLHEAVSYAKERVMFGGPIGGKQIQQVRLADMLTGITTGQLLCYRLGRMKDDSTMTPQQVSLAKRANVLRHAAQVTRLRKNFTRIIAQFKTKLIEFRLVKIASNFFK
jgi:glutaryl-CoA dehydrogenase